MKFGVIKLTFIVLFLSIIIVFFSIISYQKDVSSSQSKKEGYNNLIDTISDNLSKTLLPKPSTTVTTETPLDNNTIMKYNSPKNNLIMRDGDLPSRKKKTQIVVARYNENISFLEESPFSNHEIILYNKGKQVKCRDCVNIKDLPNVGKCDHTYLYHIINNYDNLADVTIFLPGSCLINKIKIDKTYKTIKYVEDTQNSVFIGLNYNDVYKELYGFKLDSHLTASEENQELNSDISLKPCQIRPFGKWYNSIFGNLNITLVDYTSIFAVSKEHILQHPKSYYEKIISFIDDDISPECGHYIERAWVAIFSPLPPECLYNNYI